MAERNPKMTYEEIMLLLKSYRENECLWNHSHCNYRNLKERGKAFINILIETNVDSVDEVKRRLKILRDTYNIEKNKMRKSRLSGPGPNGYYSTKIRWFRTADEFLSKCDRSQNIKNEASEGAYASESPNNQQEDRASFPELQEQDSPDPLWQYDGVYVDEFQAGTDSPCSSTGRKRSSESLPTNLAAISTKKAVRPQYQYHTNGNSWVTGESGHSHMQQMPNKRDSVNSAITQPVRDEFLYFGLMLASQLEELPKLRALILQEKIQTLVSQERIEFEKSQQQND
ncbi:uncharacterized protein LOC134217506 [Armigeres subalbatus]|uniref:uncharacterized protein LOC134217506 n=1 Tax=Armigeres subalbatus TaxID=124917 RepID=UPI002ED036EA